MPTYEYACSQCGHELEEFQPMSAKPLRKCPECGKNALERKIGLGAAILFKGGGFYETDYRSDSYKKSADADSKAASGKSESDSAGHVHTGSCACGKKPASECASGATPSAAESKPKKKPAASQ
ncbi:MAG TPA: FmdB family transcriptional regulator [Phycisphaerales bacterium]|nr:FmdB family transcriptional regulator [Phycisphaerales bacterium]